MRVEPLGDKVVIKRMEAEEATKGGIVLPGSAQEQPQEGRVLSVGAGKRLKSGEMYPLQVREGDRVLFSRWAGTQVEVDGDDLLILNEGDILAVLD